MTNQIQTVSENKPMTVSALLEEPKLKKRISEIMGDRASVFASTLISIVNSNNKLQHADPQSVIAAAMTSATLNLTINPNFGHAYIVPYDISYRDDQGQWRKKTVAQFQIGWKGIVQMAHRTGLYKTIGATEIRVGQLNKYNRLTSEYDFDLDAPGTEQNEIIGYASYFKLLGGFEKVVYWNVGQILDHAKKYSKAFQYDLKENKKTSPWSTDFPAMAKKTLVKNNLTQWGILSVEMERAFEKDTEDQEATDVTDQPKISQTPAPEITENAEATVVETKSSNTPTPSVDEL